MKTVIIPVTISYLPEGYYLATSDTLPGLIAQGKTIDETIAIAEDIAKHLISIQIEENIDPFNLTSPDISYLLDVHLPVPVSV